VGLFSSSYNKPGPGVDKDAPKKPSFFVFFEVLKRKFWNLLKVNLMFILFNIPALVIAFILSFYYLQKMPLTGKLEDLLIRFILATFMTLIPLITMGPVQAGFTYILRNYSREEHAFIWWDFKEHFVKNFKQGMAITGIDIVVVFLLGIALNFYTSSSNLLSVVATSFIALSILIFTIMHLYIYPMLVTVNLSVKNLYKNALIFSIIKLLPNILILILNLLITIAAFYYVVVGVILYVLILPCLLGLINNFYVNPIIKKYVVDPTLPEKVEDDEEDNDEDNTESFYKKEIDIVEADKTDNDNNNDTDTDTDITSR